MGELVPELSDDLRGSVFAVRFEFYQKIAAIRFGDEQAELRAEPARITLHIGVCADDGLRLIELARGFRQARAGWRIEINHKTALVKLRQKVALQLPVNED